MHGVHLSGDESAAESHWVQPPVPSKGLPGGEGRRGLQTEGTRREAGPRRGKVRSGPREVGTGSLAGPSCLGPHGVDTPCPGAPWTPRQRVLQGRPVPQVPLCCQRRGQELGTPQRQRLEFKGLGASLLERPKARALEWLSEGRLWPSSGISSLSGREKLSVSWRQLEPCQPLMGRRCFFYSPGHSVCIWGRSTTSDGPPLPGQLREVTCPPHEP